VPKTLNPQDIADFRERLCDVAERLFAEKGPEAVTVRELATELGVSPMTPYRYFADKDAMLAAVRARAFDRFSQAMEDGFIAYKAGGYAAGAEPAQPYIDFAFDNPAAYRLMFDVNQPTVAEHPELVRAMTRARATMSQGIRAASARGLVDPAQVELMSHMTWAILHGPIMLKLAGMLGPHMPARDLITQTLAAMRRGLSRPD
jgi:AcrR family transcriptional regulator